MFLYDNKILAREGFTPSLYFGRPCEVATGYININKFILIISISK